MGLYHPNLAALSPLERGQGGRNRRRCQHTHGPKSRLRSSPPRAGPGASRHSQISRSRTSPAPGSAARHRGSSRSSWLSSRRQRKGWLPWERQSNPASLLLNYDRSIKREPEGFGGLERAQRSRTLAGGWISKAGREPGWGRWDREILGWKPRQSLARSGAQRAGKPQGDTARSTLSSPAAPPQPWNKLLHQQQGSWELTCLCW